MKKLTTLALSLSAALASGVASADQKPLTCTNAQFPAGIGSDLVLTLTNGKPTQAQLNLHDQGPIGSTDGEFSVAPPTVNEDGVEVSYLSWYAGAGMAGSTHLDLIPRKMVLYAFDDNLAHNNTLFVGVINWVNGDKVEKHFVYACGN